ncbi:preprotein translocase subunit SecY [bacterium]|nr:preprotein translocase subunit SecY [bacterium]
MLESFVSAWNDRVMRNRLLVVFGGFAVFVMMVYITVPGVNRTLWQQMLHSGELFEFLGMFTGGALNNFSIIAMGITPYINASIIMQLLTVVIPKLHELQKEGGEQGRRQINQYVRYGTVGLAFLQALVLVISLMRYTSSSGAKVFYYTGFLYGTIVVLALTAGTLCLVWLGERMTEYGVGNGTSMIIFAGIVLRYPDYLMNTFKLARASSNQIQTYLQLAMFAIITLILIVAIVALTQAIRKVPVQYAKKVVGRRVTGGQSTFIPIKVNNAGVISIIFAISVLYLPATIIQFLKLDPSSPLGGIAVEYSKLMSHSGFLYNFIYFLLVIFFTYFYSAITFNIADIADNMKKFGGFIPGIRPGKNTVEFLNKIMNRITFISSILLGLIAIAPNIIMVLTGITSFYLGSTSLLIIVGVALDTMQQLQARSVMKHYQGFMKK